MEFISTKDAAAKWNISQRRVIRLAAEGRIPGAYLFGKSWMIPSDAAKPADGRTKQAKIQSGEAAFRFPFFMNHEEDDFFPSLSEEEKSLRRAQLDFLACHFEKAKQSFEELRKNAKDGHVRTAALFFLCYLSVSFSNGEDFKYYFQLLDASISENDPHQQEMELFCPYLLGCLALYQSAAKAFRFDPKYEYSPTAYPLICILSYLTKADPGMSATLEYALLEANEIAAKQLEKDGYFYETQMMHVLLFTSNYIKANKQTALYHLKKILHIAYERQMIYPAADIYNYYTDIFDEALREYPAEFANQIILFGNRIHQSYSIFMSKRKITDLYVELSNTEYQYIFYASQGFSNKKISDLLHLSERTVANRYAEIYDKLEVKGKTELIKKLKETISKDI